MYHVVTPSDRDDPPGDELGGDAEPRKEGVLHTRIPAVLERDLKRLANQLRVPVSNLVRTILEDSLRVADEASGVVEAKLTHVARAVSRERGHIQRRLKDRDSQDELLGFQPIVLAQASTCSRCHIELARGAQGWLGLRATPGPA